MATSNMYRHLTIEDRRIIEQGIREGLTKVSIAAMLGKDRTTIGKEISKHRTQFYFSKLDTQCKHYKNALIRECFVGNVAILNSLYVLEEITAQALVMAVPICRNAVLISLSMRLDLRKQAIRKH